MKNHGWLTVLIFTVGLVPTIRPAKSANHGFQLYSRNLSTTIIKTEIYFRRIKFPCETQARLVELLDHLSSASFERCT
jgi:hypothetical protein